MNPNALAFWAFLAGVGYLLNGTNGAVWGLVIGLGLSFLASTDRRRW